MSRTITIDPVTRIEGHAKVILELSDDGQVSSAALVVNELRGFERILVGMEADRMPLITARICGVCPSAHHLAAVKALDAAAGVEAPPAAKLLRELLYMGHVLHSHVLSLFVLQGPDLILGLDADPSIRNVVGVVQANPEVAKKALRLRTIGQKINEMVGGRGTHPVTAVAGGITFELTEEKRRILESWLEEGLTLVLELASVGKTLLFKLTDRYPDLLTRWVNRTYSMGTVGPDGTLSFYDGLLRMVDENGIVVAEFPSHDYDKYLVEKTVAWSYMKPVYFRKDGATHPYRVHTLGRINAVDRTGTPRADAELAEFRRIYGRPCHLTVMHTYARLIEMIHVVERAQEILADPAIFGETRVPVRFTGSRGIGHVEAPRGSLFHDYTIDDKGIVRAANLIVATQQNCDAINTAIEHAAQSYVVGKGDSALLNGIEFAIRCYDPCLACATHAVGAMPMEIEVRQANRVIHTVRRPL
ncbi:MAG: Ni/Fe hydrogenase subunit alpha [Myxococcales bacterium]